MAAFGILVAGVMSGVASYAYVTRQLIPRRLEDAIDHFWKVDPGDNIYEIASHSLSSLSLQSDNLFPQSQKSSSPINDIEQYENQTALRYERLSFEKPQIRLIHLDPPVQDDLTIRGYFKTVDIDEDISYVALSYCWGDKTRSNRMYVDYNEIKVTKNLHDALFELRRRGQLDIWVDMLCIDQKHSIELESQIKQMTLTYSRAKKVIAWLGDEDDDFRELINIFKQLVEFREGLQGEEQDLCRRSILLDLMMMWFKGTCFDPNHVSLYRRELVKSPVLAKFAGKLKKNWAEGDTTLRLQQINFLRRLYGVLQRPYWARAWILQEITVADSLQIICSSSEDRELDFDLLAGVVMEIEALKQRSLIVHFTKSHQHIANLGMFRDKWRPREPLHLLEALYRSAYTKSGRPHDRIYSLFALCFDTSRFVTKVDYEIDLGILFRKMAERSIRATKSLDIICLQGPQRHLNNPMRLPSWVPDWTSIGEYPFNRRMIKYLTGQDDHAKPLELGNYWTATRFSDYHIDDMDLEYLNQHQILRVRGRSLGLINGLSYAAHHGPPLPPRHGFLQAQEEVTVHSESEEGQENSFLSRYADIFRRGRKERQIFEALTVYKPAEPRDDEFCDFRSIWDSENLKVMKEEKKPVYDCLLALQNFPISGKPLKQWAKESKSFADLEDKAFGKVGRALQHALNDDSEVRYVKDLFNTRKRKLRNAVNQVLDDGLRLMEITEGAIGWAHPAATCGDELILIKGCSIPVILRRSPNDIQGTPVHTVVGDAYVCGAMRGERWSGKDEDLEYFYLH